MQHGHGDYVGRPFRLFDQQHEYLTVWYEIDGNGARRVSEAYLQLPSGAGKTELAAAVALYEVDTLGRHLDSAQAFIVANSERQATETAYGQCRLMLTMCGEQPARSPGRALADRLLLRRDEITRPDGSGTVHLIPAVAAAFEGLRPSFVLYEEPHEYDLRQLGRGYHIVQKSLPKRAGGWTLAISTAGASANTLGYQLFQLHEQVSEGLLRRPGWWSDVQQIPATVTPNGSESVAELRDLLRFHPAVVAGITPVSRIVAAWRKLPLHEALRYLGNRWVLGAGRLMFDPLLPTRLPDPQPLIDGEPVVAGFDGSFSRDTTAIVVAPTGRREVHLWRVWEKPADAEPGTWAVPKDEVVAALHELFARFQVVELAPDPYVWTTEIADLERVYGDRVVRFPTTSMPRMVPAVEAYVAAVHGTDAAEHGLLALDKHPTLLRHMGNCHVRQTTYGETVEKEYRDSPNKIDAAVAAVVALARADWWRSKVQEDDILLA